MFLIIVYINAVKNSLIFFKKSTIVQKLLNKLFYAERIPTHGYLILHFFPNTNYEHLIYNNFKTKISFYQVYL